MKILFSEMPLYFKRMFYLVTVVLCLLFQGCLELNQELTLNQDGSGTLEVQYILGESFTKMVELAEEMKATVGGETTTEGGLALNEEELKEQFKGEGVEIKNSLFEKKDEKFHISYTITFDNIGNLLNTKAFRKEQISFYRDKNNNLAFQMGTKTSQGDMGTEMMKDFTEGFKADIILTMPGKVLDSNADTVEGRTALTWHYTPDKLKPELMTAVCEGAGLPFLAKLSTEPKKIVTPGYVYDPTGKPDPFRPFIIEVSRPTEVVTRPLQPLQRYEISQLKLVGIIWQTGNPRAIFEDATGKGYIVVKGSYVGKKDGRVSDILENEVIITEKSTNIFGKTEIKAIKVKLHEEKRKSK